MSLKSVKTLTAAQIAKKWNIPLKTVMNLIDAGAKVEKEHDKNIDDAKQIARDHLSERPDYYKKLHKLEKSKVTKVDEETFTTGVRGIGNTTGDPAVNGVNAYVDTNTMSYEDENGNKLEWIKKITKGHNAVGFSEFNPTTLTKKTKLKEGISAGPEREVPIIGDLTGSSRKVSNEDIADKDWDDTTGKKLPEESSKPDVSLMGNQKPDAFGYGATGITKTIHEERKMDTKDHINEALDNILENNLSEMKENLLAALQEKAMEKLEEKKKDIAANYFAQ